MEQEVISIKREVPNYLTGKTIAFLDNESRVLDDIKSEMRDHPFLRDCIYSEDIKYIYNKAVNGEIDILISDYKMPKKDGITLLQEIRKNNKTIILVLYSGWANQFESENERKCLEANIFPLNKSQNTDLLITNLELYIKDQLSSNGEDSKNDNEMSRLKRVILNMGDSYIKDLESIPNAHLAEEYYEGKKINLKELIHEVKSLSPFGLKKIEEWFNAELRYRELIK